MSKRSFATAWIFGYSLIGVCNSGAQMGPGAMSLGSDLGGVGGLNPGIVAGGGETMPGAVLVKLIGEVQCMDCTLEEMGVEETPGDLYQLSYEGTHLVIKVTRATPDIVWQMVERHKLFLYPGEDPQQLTRLLSESTPGKRIEVTAGVAPEQGNLIPLVVKVK
jgi:hypothetical protein